MKYIPISIRLRPLRASLPLRLQRLLQLILIFLGLGAVLTTKVVVLASLYAFEFDDELRFCVVLLLHLSRREDDRLSLGSLLAHKSELARGLLRNLVVRVLVRGSLTLLGCVQDLRVLIEVVDACLVLG